MKPRTYICAACGGKFEPDPEWTDEMAKAEAGTTFPGMDINDPEQSCVVCDDCYRAMAGPRK